MAAKLRSALGLTPKAYRKRLVAFTNVVETLMCQKEFSAIDYSKLPSQAFSRYKKAFKRRDEARFTEFVAAAVKGEVKVNAGAIYPYEVLKGIGEYGFNVADRNAVIAQWNALPNYTNGKSILPMVDVSGSMTAKVAGNTTSAMDVAVSLGLYLSEKNSGPFRDCFLTFSSNPQLLKLKGDIVSRVEQMTRSDWAMSTNLEAAFKLILDTAKRASAPQSDMPEYVLILSDMQFNQCVQNTNDSAMKMIERMYGEAGYIVPKVVFWNIAAKDNVPVSFNKQGAALVSGFSPAITKAILAAEKFTPWSVMIEAISTDRYDISNPPMVLTRPTEYTFDGNKAVRTSAVA